MTGWGDLEGKTWGDVSGEQQPKPAEFAIVGYETVSDDVEYVVLQRDTWNRLLREHVWMMTKVNQQSVVESEQA